MQLIGRRGGGRGQQLAPIGAGSHLRLHLFRHDRLAVADFPSAAQRFVKGDQIGGDCRARLGQPVALRQEPGLCVERTLEVLGAFSVLDKR